MIVIHLHHITYISLLFKAQIKKRTGGGGAEAKEETVEIKAKEEREHQDEEVAPSPSELPRSPRMPAHLAGATRVLPPIGGKDQG